MVAATNERNGVLCRIVFAFFDLVSRAQLRQGEFKVRAAKVSLLVCWFAISNGTLPAADAVREIGNYHGPTALVVSIDAKTLYVACADSHQVAFVALPSGNVTRRVTVPAEPSGLTLTPNGSKLIVTCAAPTSRIVVLDAASGCRLATIPAGHTALSPVISSDGGRLYVCNRFDNDVSVIDLVANKEVRRVPAVREPIAAAISPDGRVVLVANHLPNMRTNVTLTGEVSAAVTFIDTQTYKTTAVTLPSGSSSLRGLCISPDGHHAFVTHLLSNFQEEPFRVSMGWINTNVVSIIDIERRRLMGTIGLDEMDSGAANPWSVICTADGRSVCVSLAGTQELSVIDLSVLLSEEARRTMSPMMGAWPIYTSLGSSFWHRIKLPGAGPRGLATIGSRVYVAEYFSDAVTVVDLSSASHYVTSTIALGPAPRLTQQRRGQALFHDAMLCYEQWQSCASCHPDGRSDALSWDLLNDGAGNPKNTKSLLLAHQTPPVMAEGVRDSAELAVRAGLAHILFAEQSEEVAAAIDVYLKSLKPVPSPHLVEGHLSVAAERGRKLFQSRDVDCSRCHVPPLYSDLKSHNVGTRAPTEQTERFDTPTLVEVWRTAPYLHDGRYTTIKELLIKSHHGLKHGSSHLELSEHEIDDLAEFVLSL